MCTEQIQLRLKLTGSLSFHSIVCSFSWSIMLKPIPEHIVFRAVGTYSLTRIFHCVTFFKTFVSDKAFLRVSYKKGPYYEGVAGHKLLKLAVKVDAFPRPSVTWWASSASCAGSGKCDLLKGIRKDIPATFFRHGRQRRGVALWLNCWSRKQWNLGSVVSTATDSLCDMILGKSLHPSVSALTAWG